MDEHGPQFDALGDRATTFPAVDEPRRYASARILSCRYRTLAPLRAFTNLRTLEIHEYPDRSLAPLSTMARLERLTIRHMPELEELAGIEGLVSLRYLYLATRPSWDASGRVTVVRTLAPIAELPNLTTLRLFGVRPQDKRVDDLLRIPTLVDASISKYPRREIERLDAAVAARAATGGAPDPD
jgi:hypothetical protein